MRLTLTGEPNAELWIDEASVLSQWMALTNLFNTSGSVEFTDDTAKNQPTRFYRARQ
jgi:hypothetical protein